MSSEARCRQVRIHLDEDGDGRPGSTDDPEWICEDQAVPDGYTSNRREDCAPLDPDAWSHYCFDRDGDGAYTTESVCSGDDPPEFTGFCPVILEWTPEPGPYDCDDADPSRIDYFYTDEDGDGYGAGPSTCGNVSEGWSAFSGDCDDTDPTIYPAASEQPDDGVDNDCDGTDSPWCGPESLDDFPFPEPSVGTPCDPNLALGAVTCSSCANHSGTLAIENR